MGILDRIKGAAQTVANAPAKVEEIRERIEERGIQEQNKREIEASAARIQKEKEIREKQAAGKITPELAEARRKRAAINYESAKQSTVEKIHNVVKPLEQIRERNIQRQMPQQKGGRTLTREEVERIARRAQRTTPRGQMGGKMTGGQFHAPMFGPNIPSGGVGKKMNFDMGSALDFPGFGGTHGKKKSQGKKMSDWFKF